MNSHDILIKNIEKIKDLYNNTLYKINSNEELENDDIIDIFFNNLTYRYVPSNIRYGWRNIVNIINSYFYKKLHFRNNINIYNRLDLINELKNKIIIFINDCNNFKKQIKNIKPMYNSDEKYSIYIKEELEKSINNILSYLNVNIKNKKIENIEHFDNIQKPKKNISLYLLIIILIIFIFYNISDV